jgi:hypothetical protein
MDDFAGVNHRRRDVRCAHRLDYLRRNRRGQFANRACISSVKPIVAVSFPLSPGAL